MSLGSRTLASFLAVVAGGCGLFPGGEDRPPEFARFEISEGECHACPLPGPFVGQGADGTLVLRLNAQYTVRTYIRTADRPDRCIYKMVGVSWDNPSREFNCFPETGEQMTLDYSFRTKGSVELHYVDPHMTVSLSEYETKTRTALSHRDLMRIPIRFVQ